MFRLEGKVPLRDYPHIRPICLPKVLHFSNICSVLTSHLKAGDDVEETETIVAGWGLLSEDASLPSDKLM